MDSYTFLPFIPVCFILADIFVENIMKHTTRTRRKAFDHVVIKVKESEQEYLNIEE